MSFPIDSLTLGSVCLFDHVIAKFFNVLILLNLKLGCVEGPNLFLQLTNDSLIKLYHLTGEVFEEITEVNDPHLAT